jgi:hypothetical protein
MMAADTEIFKLSVKPTIGILRKPSARCKISSDKPSRSVPKNKALVLIYQNPPSRNHHHEAL